MKTVPASVFPVSTPPWGAPQLLESSIMRTLVTVAILALSLPATAADKPRKNTIAVGVAGETLGDGISDWREKSLRLRRDFAPRTIAEVGVSSTRRFGRSDSQLGAGVTWPMGEKLSASVDGSYSATHRILPRKSVGGALQYEFKPAWLVRGGVKKTSYFEDDVKQGVLALEHYVNDYGVTVSWLPTRVFDVTAHSYALQAAWYYGERDSVSLTVTTGREVSTVANGVTLGKVQSAGIGGRHLFSPAWSANYGISYTKQADLYARKGLSLGLAYSY
jgi:YaiO family outer membrane protein